MIILITQLSSRQLRIIELLLIQQYEITVAYIAEQLAISSRTVHRELIVIEDYLKEFDIKLKKKSGIGVQIIGSDVQINKLRDVLKQKQPSEMSSDERRTIILCHLLTIREPIKLFALAHDLNVTMPTIGYDLDELEPIIALHQLKLIRKRGYGVELIGNESNKRKLIATLVLAHLDSSQIINYTTTAHSTINQPVIQHLINLLGITIYQTIEATIWSWQEANLLKFSKEGYSNLLLYISIGVQRYKTGHTLPTSNHIYGKSTGQKQEALFEAEDHYRELLTLLMNEFSIELSKEEIQYIENLIYQVLNDDNEINMYKDQQHIETIILELTKEIAKQTNENILDDPSLVEGLIKHLIPALKRVREGLVIRNPMLPNIKKEYAVLYNIIHHEVKKLLPKLNIPDEEIGYITMHYGAAFERLKQLPKQLRAVIVCTTGIGSSKMLAVRLSKIFPQIRQIGHYSWYESARLPREKYDFIISTVDLPIESNQYIKLSPLVTDEEIVKLNYFIKNHVRQSITKPQHSDDKPNSQLWFQELKHHSQAVINLMEDFDILQLPIDQNIKAMDELLPQLIHAVPHQDRLLDATRVIEKLIAREKQGSIVLPDSEVALLHTRDKVITTPLLAIFHLSQPISVKQEETVTINHIVLMLAPRQLDKYVLEILSEISSMLLDPRFISLIQINKAQEIKSYVSKHLEKHIKEKLDWRE